MSKSSSLTKPKNPPTPLIMYLEQQQVLHKAGVLEETKELTGSAAIKTAIKDKWQSLSEEEQKPYYHKRELMVAEYQKQMEEFKEAQEDAKVLAKIEKMDGLDLFCVIFEWKKDLTKGQAGKLWLTLTDLQRGQYRDKVKHIKYVKDMIYLVEKARKDKKLAKKQAKNEDATASTSKRSAYLEFLAAQGDIPMFEKRKIWQDMAIKERSKYQDMADLVNSGQAPLRKGKEEIDQENRMYLGDQNPNNMGGTNDGANVEEQTQEAKVETETNQDKLNSENTAAEVPLSQDPVPESPPQVEEEIPKVAVQEKKKEPEPEVDIDDMINNLQSMYKIQQVQQSKEELKQSIDQAQQNMEIEQELREKEEIAESNKIENSEEILKPKESEPIIEVEQSPKQHESSEQDKILSLIKSRIEKCRKQEDISCYIDKQKFLCCKVNFTQNRNIPVEFIKQYNWKTLNMELCKCYPYIPSQATPKAKVDKVVPKTSLKWSVAPLVMVGAGLGLGYYFEVVPKIKSAMGYKTSKKD